MPEPYRPRSGTEGRQFMARFCDRCIHDVAFQSGRGDSCPIAAATMAYAKDHPEYPKEWVIESSGDPICTAFEELGTDGLPLAIIRDHRQMALL